MAGMTNRLRVAPTGRLRLAPALHRALDLLRMDGAALSAALADEAAANPWLALSRPRRAFRPDGATSPLPEPQAAGPGLYAHVLFWIESHVPPGRERQIALALAEALEPTGWLGETPEAVAATLCLPVARVLAVLERVQMIEPTGLFARDLAECLRLQAQAAGLLDPPMTAVLLHLPLLARGGAGAVARAARLDPAAVARAVENLRGFDPKPGTGFDSGPALVSVPDLVAGPGPGDAWHVRRNPSAVPQARLRAEAAGTEADRQQAIAFVAMLDRRNAMLIAIAQAAFDRQPAALGGGLAALVPLTRRRVAQASGLSASTVSRALTGTRVITPHGTWRMAELFPAALSDGRSAAQARATLRRLIGAEDPHQPMTDAELARELGARGITASRRTVAKYRDQLGLPGAQARKHTHRPRRLAP